MQYWSVSCRAKQCRALLPQEAANLADRFVQLLERLLWWLGDQFSAPQANFKRQSNEAYSWVQDGGQAVHVLETMLELSNSKLELLKKQIKLMRRSLIAEGVPFVHVYSCSVQYSPPICRLEVRVSRCVGPVALLWSSVVAGCDGAKH